MKTFCSILVLAGVVSAQAIDTVYSENFESYVSALALAPTANAAGANGWTEALGGSFVTGSPGQGSTRALDGPFVGLAGEQVLRNGASVIPGISDAIFFDASVFVPFGAPATTFGGIVLYGRNAAGDRVVLGALRGNGTTVQSRFGTGAYATIPGVTLNAGAWNQLRVTADGAFASVLVSVNGGSARFLGGIPAGVHVSDIGLSTQSTTSVKYRWDDVLVRRNSFSGGALVQGQLNLPGRSQTGDDFRATIEVKSSGGTLIETKQIWLEQDGQFAFVTSATGNIQLRFVVGAPFLSQTVPYTVGSGPLSATLNSGDCDGNNQVTTDDYLILSDSFDLSVGDAGFDVRADLDGNGSITTDDYLLLSESFDLEGS